MCIAIAKPKDKIIPEAVLRRCMRNHDDGAGFAIVELDEKGKDELNVYKGYFDFADFWKAWQPHQHKQALLHFRRATHGLTDGNNCHPFRVNENLVLMHNGRLNGLPDDDKMSDTAMFVQEVVAPFAEMNPDFWLLPSFAWFFEQTITKNNKLVMMDVNGRWKIFNEGEGVTRDGIWYSNWSFNHDKRGIVDPMANEEYWARFRGCGDAIEGCGGEDVAEGEVIEPDTEKNENPVIDVTIETADVEEIDRVLDQYQQRHSSVHAHLI